ncbi:MAG: hypothetical protein ABIO45_15915 [Burkholderiaceae bacterium]
MKRRSDSLESEPKVPARPIKTDLTTPPDPQKADLPHERDEAMGMTGGVQSDVVRQGHDDVERGLKDTSRSTESDRTYRQLKRSG